MAEHVLAILVKAVGTAQAAKNLKGVDQVVSNIGARGGKGIRTAASNLARLGAVAAGITVGAGLLAIKSGLDSLAEREDVISATANAIEATGNKANVSAAQIRAWSEALEAASGAAVDDKAIQAGANVLLRFGAVSGATFKRALANAVDLGAGMKTGPVAASKLLGKALADPVKGITALRKAGVVLTAAEEKRIKALVKANKLHHAQGVILSAVEARYKGAAAASQGPYTRALNMLADASEDAKMALATGFLPVIERVANWLQTKLADPATLTSIRGLGDNLAGAFDKAIDFAEGVDWKSLGDGLKVAADWAGKLFGAFMSLPPEAKGVILALAGLDRLSGGAVSGIVGELGKGLIKGVLGMTAGVVNINAGVVNGGGGLPGGGGKPGVGNVLKTVPVVSTILVLNDMKPGQIPQNKDRFDRDQQKIIKTLGDTHSEQLATTRATEAVKTKQDESLIAFRAGERTSASGLASTARAAQTAGMVTAIAQVNSASRIVSAIQASRPVINVTINATGVSATYGSSTGSAGKASGGHGSGSNLLS